MVAAIVHFTDLVVNAGVIKDTLGCSRLTRVDVRSNTDVSCVFKVSGHLALTPLL